MRKSQAPSLKRQKTLSPWYDSRENDDTEPLSEEDLLSEEEEDLEDEDAYIEEKLEAIEGSLGRFELLLKQLNTTLSTLTNQPPTSQATMPQSSSLRFP